MARGALDAAGLAGLGPQGDFAVSQIPTSETFTNAAYAVATTPDRVSLQVGDPGLVFVTVDIRAKIASADATARVALFVDGVQVNFADSADGVVKAAESAYNLTAFNRLSTSGSGGQPLSTGIGSYVGGDAVVAAGTPYGISPPSFLLLRPGMRTIDIRYKGAQAWTVEQRRLVAVSLA